jgi:hypothetical protein
MTMPASKSFPSRGLHAHSPSTVHSAPAGGVVITEATRAGERNSLSDMEQWHLACRIAASKRLSKSELLPRFLLYICEQTLLGNAHTISEQRIGIHIFNRPTDYNPGEDNIVRSYARTLRKRMEEYFESEGSDETLRMEIPRGGYVPVFASNTRPRPDKPEIHSREKTEALAPVSRLEPAPFSPEPRVAGRSGEPRPLRLLIWMASLVGLIVGCALGAFTWGATHGREDSRAVEVSHSIWAELFQKDRDTLIVPADSGLGILQNLTATQVSLERYADRSYFTAETSLPGIDAANLADLRDQRYTSVVDLDIVAKLMQLRELAVGRADIRYARSITAEDLKNSNVILLGSSHTNPWVSLFEERMNFRLQYSSTVDRSMVVNERPNGKEQKQYLNGTSPTSTTTYGVIDYLPNLDGSGHVLMIQGLNMAATQAAADVLFYSPAMRTILERARLPNGALRSFELLIQTNSIGAIGPGAQIIATRFYN